MWKGVFRSRLGKASLFQGSSKLWKAMQVRVHMTAMYSLEFQKDKNMAEKVSLVKVSSVDGMEFQRKGISKLYQRPVSYQTQLTRSSIIPSTSIPLNLEQRFSLPVEESGKGKKQSQNTNPLDAKISLEGKPLKLMEKLGRLEADHSDHEYGRKNMELLARVETLHNEAKNYEFSVQSGWPSCDPLGEIPCWDNIPEYSDSFLGLNRLREAYPKVSHIQGNLADFWRSTSFPVEAEIFCHDDLLVEWSGLTMELDRLLRSLIQEYPQDIEEVASVSPSPGPGKFFDVVELLSRFPGDLIRNDENRSRVALNQDTFKGKYVLICCFHVPVLPGVYSMFPPFINLCNELYSTRDDFEIVVVARMNSLGNGEEVFHHFFSGFPKSCLAVPFKDNKRRDYICKVLGHDLINHNIFQCLLLNAEGIVVGKQWLDGEIFSIYGAEGFPFTEDILHKRDLEREDMIFGKEGNWLERVLRCNDSSPDIVYKFNPTGGPQEEMSISELGNKLKNKHVGLYLCTEGDIVPDLLVMYEKCREEKLDFEVVLVNMPSNRILPGFIQTDPKVCQEKINSWLKKHNICDWWCLPFNNSVSVRFLHVTDVYDTDFAHFAYPDKLIVIGPDVNHLDIYGLDVMLHQGIEAFPFTVEAGVKGRANKLMQITLESLFVDGDVSVFRGNNSSDSKNLAQLIQGKKNIILFIDREGSQRDFKTLASFYNQTKAVEKEDFEMVFAVTTVLEEITCHEMPWYICPENALNFKKLEELLILVGQCLDVLVVFGEDGRVCSCQMTDSQQFSLGDTLYRDVDLLLGYSEFRNRDMKFFANPRVGVKY